MNTTRFFQVPCPTDEVHVDIQAKPGVDLRVKIRLDGGKVHLQVAMTNANQPDEHYMGIHTFDSGFSTSGNADPAAVEEVLKLFDVEKRPEPDEETGYTFDICKNCHDFKRLDYGDGPDASTPGWSELQAMEFFYNKHLLAYVHPDDTKHSEFDNSRCAACGTVWGGKRFRYLCPAEPKKPWTLTKTYAVEDGNPNVDTYLFTAEVPDVETARKLLDAEGVPVDGYSCRHAGDCCDHLYPRKAHFEVQTDGIVKAVQKWYRNL